MKMKNLWVPAINALLVSCLMTAIVSLVTTMVNFTVFEVQRWLGAWALSWLIAFPTLMVVIPFVRRLSAKWQ